MRLDGHGCAVAAADCSVDDCEDAFLLVDANEDRKDGFYVGAAPSEDIWRKFELETPPRSPVHVLLCDEYGDMWAAASPPRQGFEQYSLRSKLIQDCMWSGQTAAAAVAAASDRSSPQGAAAAASWVTGDRLFRKIESFDVPSTSSSVVAAVTGPSAAASTAAAAECVGDSAAVFPYPLNREHSYSMMTPAPSDSEDEIDVVGMENTRIKVTTVRRTQQLSAVSCYQQQQLPQQAPKVTAAVAAAADRGTIIVDVNHNRLSAAVAERLLSAQKRPLRGAGAATAAVAAPAAGSHHYHHGCKRARRQQQQHSPPPSSGHASSEDSEDFDGKRSMHNVLERKRRNDLKSSFFQLRDQVPELRHQERAAKVVILAKATEYTRRLRQEELGLLAEISAERQKQARILEQLERLRTSCHRY